MRAAEDYQIQGHTEQIIDAFVERRESDDGLVIPTFVVEPSTNYKQNFRLVMASCLVDINYAPTVKVRVMNTFPTETVIKAETIIGTAEILNSPPENFLACEDEHGEDITNSARRLQFTHTPCELQNCIKTVKTQSFLPASAESGNHRFSQPVLQIQENMPQYLQGLFDESFKERT